MSDKTEQPTAKRLRKAREEGDSGVSAFAGQALGFLVAITLVPAAIGSLSSRSATDLRHAIARAADESPTAALDASAIATGLVAMVVPVLLATAISSAVVSVVQTGGFIATKKLSPDLSRLDVWKGLRGLVSTSRFFAVFRAALTAGAVLWVAYRGLRAHTGDLARLTGRLPYVGALSAEVALSIARDAALVGLALAVFDIVVVRRSWKKKLMMSKHEVKREHKESEGDPQQKAARERAHHEVLFATAIANVRTASVVIVNPTHLACALRYDEKEGDAAPVVVASGQGDLAERIVRAARDYGVPVLRDVPLARALIELEIGDAIPEALYEAVAEILREAWEEGAPEASPP